MGSNIKLLDMDPITLNVTIISAPKAPEVDTDNAIVSGDYTKITIPLKGQQSGVTASIDNGLIGSIGATNVTVTGVQIVGNNVEITIASTNPGTTVDIKLPQGLIVNTGDGVTTSGTSTSAAIDLTFDIPAVVPTLAVKPIISNSATTSDNYDNISIPVSNINGSGYSTALIGNASNITFSTAGSVSAVSLVGNDLKITTTGLPEGKVTMTIASGMIKNTGDGVSFTGDTLSDSVSITFTVQPKVADDLDVFKPFAAANRFVVPSSNTFPIEDAMGPEMVAMFNEDMTKVNNPDGFNLYTLYHAMVSDPDYLAELGYTNITGGFRLYALGIIGDPRVYDLETLIPLIDTDQVKGSLVNSSLVGQDSLTQWEIAEDDPSANISFNSIAGTPVEYVIVYDRIIVS